MDKPKITTHTMGNGWFIAEINGVPLIGPRGGYSKFNSRAEARQAANDRLNLLTYEEKLKLFGSPPRVSPAQQ